MFGLIQKELKKIIKLLQNKNNEKENKVESYSQKL